MHSWRYATPGERKEWVGSVVTICVKCGLIHIKSVGASYQHLWIYKDIDTDKVKRINNRGRVPIICRRIEDDQI